MAVAAVIFDLDGVLVDSERVWGSVREELTRELGGHWHPGALRAMMGMSSLEWSRYMHDDLDVPLPPAEISREVVKRVGRHYEDDLPLIDGAVDAVQRLRRRWPLGLASSANREIIDRVLELAGLAADFSATVSSEEVPRGKPSPDVYLEAARRLRADASRCGAVEDSHNGIRSAKAAAMRVVAVPNPHYPPDDESLALADVVVPSIGELQVEHFAV